MSRILVTGAGGHLGSLVVRHLLETANVPAGDIVAASRNPEKLSQFADRGVETRKVDFDDPATLAAAFSGIGKLLIVSTDAIGVPGKRLAQHKTAVAAARQAGVERLFYTSMPNPEDSLIPFAPDHLGTEQAIQQAGLPYTIFRNGWYQENYLMALPHALASGQWYTSTGEGRVANVAREDTARAIAAGLAAPVAQSITYTLTGPEALTTEEAAAIARKVTGKPLAVVQLTDAQLGEGLKAAGLPEGVARLLVAFDANTREGKVALVTKDVETLTGTPPQSLETFLEANKSALSA